MLALIEPTWPGNITLFVVGFLLFVGFWPWIIFKPADDSSAQPLIAMFLIGGAIGIGIVSPIAHSTQQVHARQARADLAAFYGAKDVHVSLQKHWATAHLPGCKPKIKHEMRRVDGHYRFSYMIETKDPETKDMVDKPVAIPRETLVSLCAQRSPQNVLASSVVSLDS